MFYSKARKKIFSLFVTAMVLLLIPTVVKAAEEPIYNVDDIAVINNIIETYGLNWEKASEDGMSLPEDWERKTGIGIVWSNGEENKRVTSLSIGVESKDGTLDVSDLTELQILSCDSNNLNELNLTGLKKLEYLFCSENELSKLNLTDLTKLEYLACDGNNLNKLDLTSLSSLKTLICSKNKLSELYLTDISSLETIWCSENKLSELDLSGLTNLTALYCGSNEFSELDLTGLTNLTGLACENNNLSELDLSGSDKLRYLYIEGQTLSLTLIGDEESGFAQYVYLNNPAFTVDSDITYIDGKLISYDTSLETVEFTVNTGAKDLDGEEILLSGEMKLTYEEGTLEDPVEPEDPVDPVETEDPVDPEDPEDPVEPVDPVDPEEPTELVESSDTDKASQLKESKTTDTKTIDTDKKITDVPKTNDYSNIGLMSALLLASGLGIIALILCYKKEKVK